MRHHFAQPTRVEVPLVTRPHSLGLKAFDQLTEHRLNAPSLLHQPQWPSDLLSFGRTIRRKQLQPLPLQFLAQIRTPVIAIAQSPALLSLKQLFCRLQLVHISRRQMEPDDHSRPTHPDVCAQPEESLTRQLVISISSQLTQSPAPRSTGEAADRDRETVNERDLPLDFQVLHQLLPEPFFD